MTLQLFVDDRLIATTSVDIHLMNNPLYLATIKSELINTHQNIISTFKTNPRFSISTKSVYNRRKFKDLPLL
jgi:hypothetical protein